MEASYTKQLRGVQERASAQSLGVERRLREEGELAQRLSSRNTDLQVPALSTLYWWGGTFTGGGKKEHPTRTVHGARATTSGLGGNMLRTNNDYSVVHTSQSVLLGLLYGMCTDFNARSIDRRHSRCMVTLVLLHALGRLLIRSVRVVSCRCSRASKRICARAGHPSNSVFRSLGRLEAGAIVYAIGVKAPAW